MERNPVETANPISRLFFSWLDPIFIKGYSKELEINDIYRVPEDDRSEILGDKLESEWERQLELSRTSAGCESKKDANRPSLTWAFIRWLRWKIILGGIIILFEELVTNLAQPMFLAFLIRYCGSDDPYKTKLCYYMATGIIVTAFAFPITHHPYFFHAGHLGMKMRVAACSLLYRKALRLSRTALGQTTAGQMINLISNDVNRFDMAMMFIHYLYVGPIQLVLVTFILWIYVGPSIMAGVSVLIMYIPLQFFFGKLFSRFRLLASARTDERIRIMTEILAAMRVIKMYAWEKSFRKLVDAGRRKEMRVFRSVAYTRAINGAMFFTSNKIILLLIFMTLVVTDNLLTAEKVFLTVSLINVIRLVMTQYFPNAVAIVAEMFVTIRRLENFLLLEELQVATDNQSSISKPFIELSGIRVKNIEASWTHKSNIPTLKGINFTSKPGTLTAIIGPVGSGKSSMLMALLGELPVYAGSVQLKGKIAFASQEPWAFAGTVRENILFGQPYEKEFYDKVVEVCALKQDLKILPFGDLTRVTDKGASLSGGQKARIALARAVYYNADVYILDDPLSAVDMCVGQHIFKECIKGLLKDKICILATHQVQFLKSADHIIALQNGRCVGSGTFQQLRNAGIDIVDLLSDHESISTTSSPSIEMSQCNDVNLNLKNSKLTKTEIIKITLEPKSDKTTTNGEMNKSEAAEVKAETGTTGVVHLRTYIRYFRASAGACVLLMILFITVLAQVLYSGSDYWLRLWTNAEDARMKSLSTVTISDKRSIAYSLILNETFPAALTAVGPYVDPYMNVYIFAGLVFATFVVSLIRSISYYAICIAASIRLHDNMFSSIIKSPMSFFDANPVGRILNRFARDMGQIDDQLPMTSFECVEILLSVLGILIVVAIVNPWIVLAAAFLLVALYYMRRIYLNTTRTIRRLEALNRSPIYSHLSASLNGLPVIRAFLAQPDFTKQFDDLQNIHSASWYIFMAGNRWLGVRLDMICALFITAVVVVIMLSINEFKGGDIGLAISSAMLLSGMFQWGVRQSTEVESQMISVERILQYCELPREAPLKSSPEMQNSLIGWPERGKIEMKRMSLSYSKDCPPVLRNLSLTIQPKEKIGIVGRTGAGKSSILTALFRLTEPRGEINIDGINIAKIGLHDLRKRISIIPQDAVLFSGTIRQNLDPFREVTDENLWQALDDVQLKTKIRAFAKGLEARVSEGGTNFSVGQRQLICLARAIIRKNKILVLDEATANVDLTTDALIQETIKSKFKECTVLTIAHRLQTVMDSDRILVLDAGNLVEFDEPYRLLKKKGGALFKMVQGTDKAKRLREVAKNKYKLNRCQQMAVDSEANEDQSVVNVQIENLGSQIAQITRL